MLTQQDRYLETKVHTASPEQLHLMVIDAAVRATRSGIDAINAGDFEVMFEKLGEARGFVGEILSGIRDDHLPDVADSLKALFAFVFKNLVEADRERDADRAEDALIVLEHHRETWRELIAIMPKSPQTEIPKPHIIRRWET